MIPILACCCKTKFLGRISSQFKISRSRFKGVYSKSQYTDIKYSNEYFSLNVFLEDLNDYASGSIEKLCFNDTYFLNSFNGVLFEGYSDIFTSQRFITPKPLVLVDQMRPPYSERVRHNFDYSDFFQDFSNEFSCSTKIFARVSFSSFIDDKSSFNNTEHYFSDKSSFLLFFKSFLFKFISDFEKEQKQINDPNLLVELDENNYRLFQTNLSYNDDSPVVPAKLYEWDEIIKRCFFQIEIFSYYGDDPNAEI